MALHLRQIEIGASATLEELAGVVEKVEPEIYERTRQSLALLGEMAFVQMPTARAHDQHRGLAVQAVDLARIAHQLDRAAHRIEEILLATDEVRPSRGERIL